MKVTTIKEMITKLKKLLIGTQILLVNTLASPPQETYCDTAKINADPINQASLDLVFLNELARLQRYSLFHACGCFLVE